MAASFAVKAAEHWLKKGGVTQAPRNEGHGLPHLAIRASLPVGINESVTRGATLKGFAATFVQDWIDPYSRAFMLNAGAFTKNINAVTKRHPELVEHMDEEQSRLKASLVWPKSWGEMISGVRGKLDDAEMRSTLIGEIFSGTPRLEGLKVTEILGAHDPYFGSRKLETMSAVTSPEKGLGRNLMESSSATDRKFAIDARHYVPWLNGSAVHRMSRAVSESLKLRN